MKMRLWNDLNNILILDTCAARNFFKKIRNSTSKNNRDSGSIIDHFHKKNIILVNIRNFREYFSDNKEGITKEGITKEEITKTLRRLGNYIKIKYIESKNCIPNVKNCISKEDWKYLEMKYKKLKEKYPKIDDHWIMLKIKISFPKKNLFLITEDSKFIKFLTKSQEIRNFRNENKLEIFDCSVKNLKYKKNCYNKNINDSIYKK